MPLPESVAREKRHDRKIHCEGFKRTDGLWDIEAHLVDKRTFNCGYDDNHRGGLIKAGEPVHEMFLRITIDSNYVIQEACAVSDHTPFGICSKAAASMHKLSGIRIGKGWIRVARTRISADVSCTHIMDLLYPIATTAYQTLHAGFEEEKTRLPQGKKPPLIDTCMAFSADGDIVLKLWPEYSVRKSP